MLTRQLLREDYIPCLTKSPFGRMCLNTLGIPNHAVSLRERWSHIAPAQRVPQYLVQHPVLFLHDAPVFARDNPESLDVFTSLRDEFGTDFEVLDVDSNIGRLFVVNVLRTEPLKPVFSSRQTGYALEGQFSGQPGFFRLQTLPDFALYVADDGSEDGAIGKLGQQWGVRFRDIPSP